MSSRWSIWAGLAAMLLVRVPALAASAISVEGGRIAGVSVAEGVDAYLGIPYAAPPVGELRFRPPQPVRPWPGVRDTGRFGPDCIMPVSLGRPQSEDCLLLNVWAPAGASAHLRPVMVWIFGSAFRVGSAATPIFDGSALAKQGVLVVSMNYRLGALGFLAHPALAAESPHAAAGNYGVLDTLAALEWVKRNITRFGGDPDQVTVFGQSAGSETVSILTASPLARGAFERAIGQSGSAFGEREPPPLAQVEATGSAFAAKLGAATAADLRRLPARAFAAPDAPAFEPNVDGWLLPEDVYDLYAQGRQNDVPLLIGSNADEIGPVRGMTAASWDAAARAKYGAHASAYLSIFPVRSDAEAPAVAGRAMTLLLGDFNTATWATLQSRTGRAPVYQYRFAHVPPSGSPPGAPPRSGAYHGAEEPYVFDTLNRDLRTWTADDRRLASELSGLWITFARTGRPDSPALDAPWPRVEANAPQVMVINGGFHVAPRPKASLIARLGRFFYGPDGLFGHRSDAGLSSVVLDKAR